MTDGTILLKISPPSTAEFLHVVGLALLRIKSDEGLTYEAMGEILDKNMDSIADYVNGRTVMSGLTLLRACNRWPEAFGKPVMALAVGAK